jgi:hypothetical protein
VSGKRALLASFPAVHVLTIRYPYIAIGCVSGLAFLLRFSHSMCYNRSMLLPVFIISSTGRGEVHFHLGKVEQLQRQ